jgi:16S rRNA (guanine(527)-N(7))-methyltransferase RsmG
MCDCFHFSRREKGAGSLHSAKYLKDLLEKAGYVRGSEPVLKILRYLELLEKWNRRINLTSSTQSEVIRALLSESIWAAGLYPAGNSYHLDIGSGAGFPALIMRILNRGMRLDLVESRGKKAAFLETVIQELGLTETQVFNTRLQDYLKICSRDLWDCISWKGVKLSDDDLSLLAQMSKVDTRFWLFHGEQLPLEKPEDAGRWLQFLMRKDFPGKRGWHISEYQPAPVRFT